MRTKKIIVFILLADVIYNYPYLKDFLLMFVLNLTVLKYNIKNYALKRTSATF